MLFFLQTDLGGNVCSRIKPSYTGSKDVSEIAENAIGSCKNKTHKCNTNALHQYIGYVLGNETAIYARKDWPDSTFSIIYRDWRDPFSWAGAVIISISMTLSVA